MDDHFLSQLVELLGPGGMSLAQAERSLHSHDESSHPASLPEVVVWPETTGQVSRLAALANEKDVPLTAWGAGSSMEGNPIPVKGGVVVDFSRMNRLLEVFGDDFQAVVQPGILYKDMNRSLARYGLFFAPDPGANASIGGMVANNAAGTRTVKYGATRDNVLALEVVLASGEVIRTGSRSVKQSAGYDLTHLFIGSEGTLGLVTEATLKLAPLPEFSSAAIAEFPSVEAAAQAVFEIIGSALDPAALEILDTATFQALGSSGQVSLAAGSGLLLEFHGSSREAMAIDLERAREICAGAGCQSYTPGLGREARDRLWETRHQLSEILKRAHPGQALLVTDTAVPISQFPAMVSYARQVLDTLQGVDGYLFGHAGDGNLHANIFYPDTPEMEEVVQRTFNARVVDKAISLGGTCTGEHGIGIGKQQFMVREHGRPALGLMRRLKGMFDPRGILNPGKIIPEEEFIASIE